MQDETARMVAVRRLFIAFPTGSTTERIDLYLEKTKEFLISDIAAGVERLIAHCASTRAPSVAELLTACREARSARLERSDRRQLPAETHEQATADDVRRLRELGERGWFWCSRTGAFARLSKHALNADLREPGPHICHRSHVNAAWLAHVKGEPDAPIVKLATFDALEHAQQEAPF